MSQTTNSPPGNNAQTTSGSSSQNENYENHNNGHSKNTDFKDLSDEEKQMHLLQFGQTAAEKTREAEEYKKKLEEVSEYKTKFEQLQTEHNAMLEEKAAQARKNGDKTLEKIWKQIEMFAKNNPDHDLLKGNKDEVLNNFKEMLCPKSNCAADVNQAEKNRAMFELYACASVDHYEASKRLAENDTNPAALKRPRTSFHSGHSTLHPDEDQIIITTPHGKTSFPRIRPDHNFQPAPMSSAQVYKPSPASYTPQKPTFQADTMQKFWSQHRGPVV
jgi:hypothetical protein